MRLGEWLDTWYQLYVEPSELAPSTKGCYHRAVAAVPEDLRLKELADLSALDILPWVQLVAREHPRAAQLDRVMLSKALRIASKVGLCRPGIVDAETVPKPVYTPSKALILNPEELRTYMMAAQASTVAPVLMLCCCGLRRGEAMGIRWQDLNLSTGVLMIRGQRRGDKLVPLKTAHSYRQIQLPDEVIKALWLWPRSLVTDWLCAASTQRIYKEHRRILRECELPAVTLHGLRHSFATAAAMGGVPMKLLQGALGHAHYSITADLYADHLPPVSAVADQVFSA